jgi:hypothetical protein
VHAVLEGVQSPFSKHLIISILPVEEVPITPHSKTSAWHRIAEGVVIGVVNCGRDELKLPITV